MAQTANFTPVVLEKDNSIQIAAQSITNAFKERSAQQAAVKEAIVKQRNANDAIFGAESKNIRSYYDNSKSLAPAERDRILTEKMAILAKIPKDSPEYLRYATQVTNEASSAFSGINQTFADTDAVIDEMTKAGKKINPDAIRRLALTNMYEYGVSGQDNSNIIQGLQSGVIEPTGGMTKEQAMQEAMMNGPVQFKKLKTPSQLQDFRTNLLSEVNSSPELYADRGGVKQDANTNVSKFVSSIAKKGGSSLTLDPTGTKTTNIGTDYTITPFDIEEKATDKLTGLGYTRPRLNTSVVTGVFYKGGDNVETLGDEQYALLINSGGKAVQDELTISALENIREHNAEAFRRANIASPDKITLTVSKNNVDNFRDISGFIDPFDEGQIEVFQRAAAADLLKQSGRYDEKGYVSGFVLDRGVNKANPKSGVTVNVGGSGPGFDNGKIQAYNTLLGLVNSGEDIMKSTKIDNNTRNALLTIADEIGVFRTTGIKVSPNMIEVKKAPDGSIGIYSKSTGDLLTALSEQSFNMRVNEFSSKAENNAAAGGQPDPAKSGKKTYNPATGKFE